MSRKKQESNLTKNDTEQSEPFLSETGNAILTVMIAASLLVGWAQFNFPVVYASIGAMIASKVYGWYHWRRKAYLFWAVTYFLLLIATGVFDAALNEAFLIGE